MRNDNKSPIIRKSNELLFADFLINAAGEVVLLEAMEAAAHAPPQPVGTGSRSRNGAHGDAQPERLLADEPE
jgi:hypothetical protein